MTARADTRLSRLLQLASPTLPVGAYSYSQGLEAAVEAGLIVDATSAKSWIDDVLAYSVALTEAPLLLRLIDAWRSRDLESVRRWNTLFLATRETAELHAETIQMGYSLVRLLRELNQAELAADDLTAVEDVSFPCAFALAVARWDIDPAQALVAYLWAWAENQVMAAIKGVPLGQTDGQRMLLALGDRLSSIAERVGSMADEDIGSFAPRLAILSSRHETQYSRLFRS